MSRKKKIIVIFHLCFAFAYFSWLLILPYAQSVVSQKSERALFATLLQHTSLVSELPLSDQLAIKEGYTKIENRKTPSFLGEVCSLFFLKAPPFALAWLFFSIIISLLLLFQIEGAHKTVWLLPFLIIAYAYFTSTTPPPPNASLFPSEEYVLSHYSEEKDSGWFSKHKRLLGGWHRYLITEWGKEKPSSEPAVFEMQLEKALFAFNMARVKEILSGKGEEFLFSGFTMRPSSFRFFSYLLWNVFFAWMITRKEKHSKLEVASNPS